MGHAQVALAPKTVSMRRANSSGSVRTWIRRSSVTSSAVVGSVVTAGPVPVSAVGCVVDACAVVEVAGVDVVEDRVGLLGEQFGPVDVGQLLVEDGADCDPNG